MNEEGEVLWRRKFDGAVYTKPLIIDGRMYIISWDCNLYCIDAKTLGEIWRFATSNPSPVKLPPPLRGMGGRSCHKKGGFGG